MSTNANSIIEGYDSLPQSEKYFKFKEGTTTLVMLVKPKVQDSIFRDNSTGMIKPEIKTKALILGHTDPFGSNKEAIMQTKEITLPKSIAVFLVEAVMKKGFQISYPNDFVLRVSKSITKAGEKEKTNYTTQIDKESFSAEVHRKVMHAMKVISSPVASKTMPESDYAEVSSHTYGQDINTLAKSYSEPENVETFSASDIPFD
jgi:hypothetical protein